MKVIGFEENRKIQLELLVAFDEYCRKKGLVYFLGYGSLIGAIRHKGFIPWDDDIDLLMPRDDYEALISEFNRDIDNPYIRLISPIEDIAKHTIVKIIDNRTIKIEKGVKYKSEKEYLGIDLDVFPIDGQPDKDDEFIKWRKKLIKYYRAYSLMIMDYKELGHRSKIEKIWLTVLYRKKHKVLMKANALHQKYPYDESKYVGVCENMYVDDGDRVKKECYDYPVEHLFENRMINIPVGYECVLHNIYGDYMKLPPIEMQRTHHENNVFWRE